MTLSIRDELVPAVAEHRAGRLTAAEALYRQVLSRHPGDPETLHLLAMLSLQTGRAAAAVGMAKRALERRPSVEYRMTLAAALTSSGRHGDAEACCRQAIAERPSDPDLLMAQGSCRRSAGLTAAAADTLRRVLAIRPDFAEAAFNLGNALQSLGEWDGSATAYRQALRHRPTYAEALNNLAPALQEMGRLGEAVTALTRALALVPDHLGALSNMGQVRQAGGETSLAASWFRRALSVDPDRAAIHSNLLFTLCYAAETTESSLFSAYGAWSRRFARPLAVSIVAHDNEADGDRPLRVGYVSADFRRHAVANTLLGLIERHDRRAFAVTCYASIAVADEYTRRFREASVHWRDISRLDDAQAAAMIRRDAIDIVVLVAGHTAGNRPLVAARRPAPVQVSLYDLTTTGLDTIDAWITDPYLHPADTAERFTEKLVRVPFLHLHEPPDPTPAVVPPPVLESGAITFGSCNNPAKLTSEVLDIWARILVETPGSRLLLKYQDRFSDLGLQRRVAAAFAARGVVRDRLVFGHGRLDRPRQLATLNRVDIALDPFPFNGSNTTFEALWMGVPVIALAGRRFLGRVSASMLHVLDLDDCIAATPAGYVETAKSWAASHRRLADLRERLRRRIAASPLCDPATYARNVENVYRELWRTWCRGSLNRPP